MWAPSRRFSGDGSRSSFPRSGSRVRVAQQQAAGHPPVASRPGHLSEEQVDSALREIRLALLEADVHFKVVKTLIERVRERARRPGDPEEPDARPGGSSDRARRDGGPAGRSGRGPWPRASRPPSVVLMVGLQGSGKTTSTAKLARWLARGGGTTRCSSRPTSTVPRLETSSGPSRTKNGLSPSPPGPLNPRSHPALRPRRGPAGRARLPARGHRRPAAHRRGPDGGARGSEGDRRAQRGRFTSPTR